MGIEKLNKEQQGQVLIYRDRYWRQATSTEPADRPRADAAARKLAEVGGVEVREVVWVESPMLGEATCETQWDSLRDALWDSLWGSRWGSLRDSLVESLVESLRGSLRDSLRDALWDSLWGSRWGSLRESLRGSLWGSLRDSPWLCWYTYTVDALGVAISDDHRALLHLHNEIAASCFALWIVPGAVILCDRPETVEISDGRLVGMTWRR